jgi:TrfA protein
LLTIAVLIVASNKEFKMAIGSNENDKTHFHAIAARAAASAPTTFVQLGLWPDDKRGAPNAFLRSAVFSGGKPITRVRTRHERKLLPVLPPFVIYYTGPQLYQPDFDVCLELWHRCRLSPLGDVTTFHVRSLLQALGRHTGKANYEDLRSSIDALIDAKVEVKHRDPEGRMRGDVGHLVESLAYDDVSEQWRVRVNPDIARLFAPNEHTWLPFSARLALGQGYLAKWLHAYFLTHAKPLPLSVERLRGLSGSSAGRLRKFRESLRVALEKVARVEGRNGRIFQWRIDDDDLVHVTRSACSEP